MKGDELTLKNAYRVRVEPGDVVVLQLKRPYPEDTLLYAKEKLQDAFPNNRVLISLPDAELVIFGPGSEEEATPEDVETLAKIANEATL